MTPPCRVLLRVLNLHVQVGAELSLEPESRQLARPFKRLGIAALQT